MNSHCGSWNFKWIPESSKRNYRGQNPLVQRVLYIIVKILKRKCLKWALMTHLDIWNTSSSHKKNREPNWQLDFRPLKITNQPNFLTCRQCATYYWKAMDQGYNFALDLIAIEGLHTKLWVPKIVGVPTVGILGQNAIWMWPPCKGANNIIRGKVVVSPKCGLWWVSWVWIRPWLVLAPKVLKLCTNPFVLVLCISMWIIEACQLFLVSSWSSEMPLYPSIVLQVRERPQLLALPLFSVWDSHFNPSRSWECQNSHSWDSHNFGGT
jgi:hypothetical protein